MEILHFIYFATGKKAKVRSCLCEPGSRPEALYNLVSDSWLAWANDIAAHYAAIHCPCIVHVQRTIGPLCSMQTYHRPNQTH